MAALQEAKIKRISIIGPSGSGKSKLARRLGQITGLPVVHLDRHFWQPGWQPTPAELWQEKVLQLVEKPAWIMDGNYRPTLHIRVPLSDKVMLLDYPRRVYLRRLFGRYFSANLLGTPRPDIAPQCEEQWWRLPEHLFHGWGWPQRARPDILAQLDVLLTREERLEKLVWLRSPRETNQYLQSLRKSWG